MAIIEKPSFLRPRPILVNAPDGKYSGVEELGCEVFRGIVYAKAARFERPLPVKNRQFEDGGLRCPQDGVLPSAMSENCLHLNLFRPIRAQQCPVLVYIHGGSFLRGSNAEKSTAGHMLAREQNIIVVRINYRLGLFGFLDFSSYGSQYDSNPGISDVLAALRFIKKNIEAFGGNPENITLMGESAGGGITAALAAHIEEPLFHKTILSSPVPAAFISREESQKRSQQFLSFIGLKRPEQLQRLHRDLLAPLSRHFADAQGQGVATFRPGLDGIILKDFPIVRFTEKKAIPRPTLVGVTGDEMSILNLTVFARYWNIEPFIKDGLAKEKKNFSKEMYALYEQEFGKNDSKTQLYSDTIVRLAAVWYAQAASSVQNTWIYRFDYTLPFTRRIGLRAFHTIDLYFIFGNLPKPLSLQANLAIQTEIQEDFTSFLKKGSLPWQQVKEDNITGRCYGNENICASILPKSCMDFWNKSQFKIDCHSPVNKQQKQE